MLNGFVDTLEVPTEVLNMLRQPASLSVEPLRTMIDLVMSIFSGEKVLNVEKNRNLWNLFMNHGVESVNE